MDQATKLLIKTLSEVKRMSVEEYNKLFDLTFSKENSCFAIYEISENDDIGYMPSSLVSNTQLYTEVLASNSDKYTQSIFYEYTETSCSVYDLNAA